MDKGPPHTDHRKWVKISAPGTVPGAEIGKMWNLYGPSGSSGQREATASDGIRLVGADSIPLASARRRKLTHSVAPPLPTGPPMGDWRRR